MEKNLLKCSRQLPSTALTGRALKLGDADSVPSRVAPRCEPERELGQKLVKSSQLAIGERCSVPLALQRLLRHAKLRPLTRHKSCHSYSDSPLQQRLRAFAATVPCKAAGRCCTQTTLAIHPGGEKQSNAQHRSSALQIRPSTMNVRAAQITSLKRAQQKPPCAVRHSCRQKCERQECSPEQTLGKTHVNELRQTYS